MRLHRDRLWQGHQQREEQRAGSFKEPTVAMMLHLAALPFFICRSP
jgi:hypothetical protein